MVNGLPAGIVGKVTLIFALPVLVKVYTCVVYDGDIFTLAGAIVNIPAPDSTKYICRI